MNKYLIRFNKTKGQEGRGSSEHAWRVFENGREYLVKHIRLFVPSEDEVSKNNMGFDDWNICCYGYMTLDKETATAIITQTPIVIESSSNAATNLSV